MISAERKKAQDKLRRKYGYHTSTDYGRGTALSKTDQKNSVTYSDSSGKTVTHISELCVQISHREHCFGETRTPICLHLWETLDNGEDVPKDKRFQNNGSHSICLTLEELELITEVAKSMAKENHWSRQ